jgi:hypothetical protein
MQLDPEKIPGVRVRHKNAAVTIYALGYERV